MVGGDRGPLPHDGGGGGAAVPRLELLPAVAQPPLELRRRHRPHALGIVEGGAVVTAAALQRDTVSLQSRRSAAP